ncbi:S-methyl-5'-thioadenosine phosphorylase [Candidatus Bathyarchaeota archaeon]|nr:S-methyl-5'-thioadenosine phosphorylase [Candidatus Bathyarchaeota archaeon]
MEQAKLGIIEELGLADLLSDVREIKIGTPYGPSPTISVGKLETREAAILPRRGRYSIPPHKVNYRALIWALHKLGVERIIAVHFVDSLNPRIKPQALVIPDDFIDFTKTRSVTFYDAAPTMRIDSSHPFCPELRAALIHAEKSIIGKAWGKGVCVCSDGPRYETPAEVRMFRALGGDLVGTTVSPEPILARELETCYVAVCLVCNLAAGIPGRLTMEEAMVARQNATNELRQIIKEAVKNIPEKRNCPCPHALEGARV